MTANLAQLEFCATAVFSAAARRPTAAAQRSVSEWRNLLRSLRAVAPLTAEADDDAPLAVPVEPLVMVQRKPRHVRTAAEWEEAILSVVRAADHPLTGTEIAIAGDLGKSGVYTEIRRLAYAGKLRESYARERGRSIIRYRPAPQEQSDD